MKDDLSQKNTRQYDIFCNYSAKTVFPKILLWNMIFLVLSGNISFFPKNMILFLRQKMKNHLAEKNKRNMIFTIYLVKMVFLFSTNMIQSS